MRALLVSALLMVVAFPAWAYERPDALSLNGEWEFTAVEPMIDIVPDRYSRPDFPTLSPEWGEVIDPAAKIPWEADWHMVQVPQAWESFTSPGYNEAGWYMRYMDIPPEWVEEGRRTWLEFDAVATAAGVWVDGQFVGAHVGDYSRWRVELTEIVQRKYKDALSSGRAGFEVLNPYTLLISVYVDELPFHITQGFLSMIAPHHGGIWQDVRMYSTGAAAIEPDGVAISTTPEDGGEAYNTGCKLTANVDCPGGDLPDDLKLYLRFILPEMHPQEAWIGTEYFVPINLCDVSEKSGGYQISFSDKLWLEPWSPDHPGTAEATVSLVRQNQEGKTVEVFDSVAQRFARRSIEMQGSDVLLNGKPIYIRSALNWGCYPGVYGPLPTPAQVREEFSYIKGLGFNAETVCLINMPDYFYDIADEMGVLIWQEYPTWHNTFTNKDQPTLVREFESYFRRDRNHPSIIMRSMSVEAGVEDQEVMGSLINLARSMTDTPVQDNNSWFWLSNEELTDWYGEDNYLNNDQWARHMLNTLPGQLDELPEKPYIIGESILCNTWVDVDGLASALESNGSANDGDGGGDARPTVLGDWQPPEGMLPYIGGPSEYPWWFPSCYASCVEVNTALRDGFNYLLPEGKDIVNDYLMPQSFRFNLGMRRFQAELMHADPRYAGYTVNVVRDMPLIRAGLIDDLGRPRWSPEEWSWHNDFTASPVMPGEEDWSAMLKWDSNYGSQITLDTPVLALSEGYTDLAPLLEDWKDVRFVADHELSPAVAMVPPALDRRVLITSVLTHNAVMHMQNGGAVILLTSKWPGALGSHHHFFWRDSMFVPPLGPWEHDVAIPDRIIDLLQYDLIETKSQAIPVDALGITNDVSPLVRLYDTHDLSEVVTYDMAFATRVSDGLLIATSVDHGSEAGQWVLGRLAAWADTWVNDMDYALRDPDEKDGRFPVGSLEPAKIHELAVARANGIIPLDEGWQFALDEDQSGQDSGWMEPGFDDSGWETVKTGISWEALGYSYNGMAWYRKKLTIPENWSVGKVRLIADGIDDAYTVWINGKEVKTHGSFTDHEKTVWLQQTVTDLTDYLVPGQENTIALQVVDITGQGGIFKPLYLAVE